MTKVKAFTITEPNIVNRLMSDVFVFDEYVNQSLDNVKKWKAVWDTGAELTCIAPRVSSELKLTKFGEKNISGATNTKICNTYCIDIILPNNLLVKDVVVAELHGNTNYDLLIGMDIIRRGNFTVTNYNGQTKFSFISPSIEHLDYVDFIRNKQYSTSREQD